MQTETILYIILSGFIALFVALFQYKYMVKQKSRRQLVLTVLRFVTVFSLLLLLINPKFENTSVYLEKPNLVVAVDNSNSITYLKQDAHALSMLESIVSNAEINKKFHVQTYTFGDQVKLSDSIGFNEQQTNLDRLFHEFNQIYKQSVSPTILISDGNQTIGSDYVFTAAKYKQPVYSVILGDSIVYSDLKIQQLNINKYAYLKNKFPVEVILVYHGVEPVSSLFKVQSGSATIFSKKVNFTKDNNSQVLNFYLPANQVGVHTYKAILEPLENERNTVNNYKEFAVEVIDQKTNVAIVSDMLHPDLGALKKSIEANEQRQSKILNPYDFLTQKNDFQLVVLYQPNNSFNQVFDYLKNTNSNYFLISGTKTNWRYLNNLDLNVTHEITNQTEDYQAVLNTGFSNFIVEDLEFELFPPLKSNFGEAKFKTPFQTILYKKVGNYATESSLLATLEHNGRREAILFGENIWQWRAQSYLNDKSFKGFDNFIGKLVQYLASTERKTRLDLDYNSFYEGNSSVILKAQFFNKNYEFDSKESLLIKVTDKISEETKSFPLILKNNYYQVDLSNLPASEYNFTVSATNEKIYKSGSFKILEYHIEQQFLNANLNKLQQIAETSNGNSYFATNSNDLINDILKDERYKPIQKSHKNVVPLIDWKYLLVLIVFCLSAEWFIRKYNGLI
ncbi:VWA domain-containing protein [Xanthomarina sp. F2636L]|uniref:VWA domain-containing protein n=1 Tax=Xanthomarina sp. F2636L TaxID=2996018 RepID=UPI00225E1E43|nr:VWA domain-containing protein [Xanthomarina sp. F2636L]MCX7549534.1 VWA domain-containing protein [Xanthomarina sp. F2636L]